MRAFIYTGGEIFPDNKTEHPKGDDLRIAADSGYRNAVKLGDRVDIFVGDFDSLDEGELDERVEVVPLKPEKDVTDTQAAVDIALEKGADDIYIVGGLSGRLDHTLSNISILIDMKDCGRHAVIFDGRNRVRYIRNDSYLIARTGYKYLSVIAADDLVKGVEMKGVKYPLHNAKLKKSFQYAVSNEVEGNCAFIAVKKGGLFIVESRDR